MRKLIILRGLPGSGKTTKARELIAAGKAVRVNRDVLREMLHFGHYSPENENEVRRVEGEVATHCLCHGLDVVSDDTNLNDSDMRSWEFVAHFGAATVEVIHINTPLEECIRRDAERPNPVGEARIREMAEWR